MAYWFAGLPFILWLRNPCNDTLRQTEYSDRIVSRFPYVPKPNSILYDIITVVHSGQFFQGYCPTEHWFYKHFLSE